MAGRPANFFIPVHSQSGEPTTNPSPLLVTAATRRERPPWAKRRVTATRQRGATSRPRKQRHPPPTAIDPQPIRSLVSQHQNTRTRTRCHVAHCDVAVKWTMGLDAHQRQCTIHNDAVSTTMSITHNDPVRTHSLPSPFLMHSQVQAGTKCLNAHVNHLQRPCAYPFPPLSLFNNAQPGESEDFTLPHIFRLDSRWTPADSRWISAVHPPFFPIFSLVGTQPNFSPESIWTPAGLQAHHLDCMDSISLHSQPARLHMESNKSLQLLFIYYCYY